MRRSSGESGAALVELAAFVPIVALLVSAAIDYGRFNYMGIMLANGASAGAHFGAQNVASALDSAGIEAVALADAAGVVPAPTASTSNSCVCSNGTTYACVDTNAATYVATHCLSPNYWLTYVSVTLTATYTPWVAYPGLPTSIAISQTAQMQVSP